MWLNFIENLAAIMFGIKYQQRVLSTLLLYAAVCIPTTTSQGATFNTTQISSIQTAILNGYLTNTRPNDSVIVDIGFGVKHITKLDTITQSLSLVGFVLLAWDDTRLAWNSADYGGVTEVYLTPTSIWVPPIMLDNAATEVEMLGDDSSLSSTPVLVTSDGEVKWLAPANFESNCDINIQFYPFDKQSCDIIITSWMYTQERIYFATSSFPTVNLDVYQENGEWDLTSSSTDTDQRTLLGHTSSTAEFTIVLSRKYSYYLLNMLLPCLFLIILSVFVFILPSESGERIGYSLTILLSLSVIMTLVSDSIPPTSTHTCYLSVYLLMGFLICALVTFTTVFVLKVHHMGDQGYEMTDRIQRFAKILARMTFSRLNKVASREHTPTDASTEKKVILHHEKENHVERPGTAWSKNGEGEYSFSEIAVMLDKVSLVFFSFVNLIVFFVFMIILATAK